MRKICLWLLMVIIFSGCSSNINSYALQLKVESQETVIKTQKMMIERQREIIQTQDMIIKIQEELLRRSKKDAQT